MKLVKTNISDAVIIEPTLHNDRRGYFMESFREDWFLKNIRDARFIQDNESKSVFGVLRGLHYQLPPFAQSKLVRVVAGKILDVAVDIRAASSTFGAHISITLSDENKRQLFIPQGFAHGFVVLSDYAIVQYKVDLPYSKEHERGVIFDDPALGIDWVLPRKKLVLSEKDLASPLLKDAQTFIGNGALAKKSRSAI